MNRIRKILSAISFNGRLLPALLIPALLVTSGCHKKVEEYYPSGRIRSNITYKGRQMDGPCNIYYESGQLMQKATYKNDRLDGLFTNWFVDGTKKSEEVYMDGFRNGQATYWDELGNLIEQRTYRNDTLNGEYRVWFPSGMTRVIGRYDQGLFDSVWQYYSQTGIKVGEGIFKKGRGTVTGLDYRGRKTREVSYSGNKKNGSEVFYDENGDVTRVIQYRDDKVVETPPGR